MTHSEPTTVQGVTKGNGNAVHIAYVYDNGNLATLCDKWGASGVYSSRIARVAAAPTCKRCLNLGGAR